MRTASRSTSVAAAVFVALLALAAPSAMAAPGTPQPATSVFLETFENGTGASALGVQSYTGAAAADNAAYGADPFWQSGTDSNGWILNSSTPTPPSDPSVLVRSGGSVAAAQHTVWENLGFMATALGLFRGESPAAAASNDALSEYTANSTDNDPAPAPGAELRTTTNAIPMVNGHFYEISADYAAMDYLTGTGTGCDLVDPQLSFSLLTNGAPLQVGSGLDPCTASGNQSIVVNDVPVRVASLTSDAILWSGGSTAGIELANDEDAVGGNDSAFDNPQVIDATPSLDKSFSPATLDVGQATTLTFTITNTSELAAKDGWSFTDNLPAGMTVASPSGASTTCSSGQVTAAAGGPSIGVTGNLDAGQTSCTVSVNVTASASGTFTNGPGNVTSTGLNSPPPATVHFNGADLSLTKTASPSPLVPGTNETYRLVVTNHGPDAAVNTVVSDPLPAGLTFVSGPGCTTSGQNVTCAAGDLASGASKTFTVTARVASSANHAIDNTATVRSDTHDPDTSNNSSTAHTPIRGESNLSITKTASVSRADQGGQVLYTLVVKNAGPSDATGVKVSDPAPAGLTLQSARAGQGTCSITSGNVSCSLGTIRDGGSTQILVTAQVAANATGSITNKATVTGDQQDPNGGNNSGGSTITVNTPPTPPAQPGPPPGQSTAELEIVKTANHKTVTTGQQLTYKITVTNRGPSTATGVKVTDTLGAPVKLVSVKSSQGTCTKGTPVMTCTLGTIRSGGKVTITVVVMPKSTGTLHNSASVTGDGSDPRTSNNIDAVSGSVVKPALKVTKVADHMAVKAGQSIKYTIRVTNPTGLAVANVRTCDNLPSGLVYVSSSPKAKLSKGQHCWTAKSLGAHKTISYMLTARALAGAAGTKTNTATVSGPTVRTSHARRAVRVAAGAVRAGGVTG